MDERCPDCTCDIKERLENLQVLRHIMMRKKKEFEEIKKERCTARDVPANTRNKDSE
ncbi:MAG: hypothetical protein A4E64_01364 [Syntrophorhabdus sp. PtaU1.Bin058]|nr:MAG: hypothetical protein A4E64_01364 [Syntrophorhabdus sp. PtaU1.Bin058]